jgi:O-antigen biosynthesis protein
VKTSVVIPVHGNWGVARQALDAVGRDLDGTREVIVVDDASPDLPPDGLGATVVRNDRNLGFGPSCNRGAREAAGELLLFLNSDAVVAPGAVRALEAAMDGRAVGAAAAVLLNEGGTIQEAGSAIGRDAITYPVGAGAAMHDARWCFRRDVDYGSAACLIVRRSMFDELGGFDDRYAPGYFEDADFCLRLAERGLRTVLEPAACAVHIQWGSGTRERAKALVRRNRERFLERWGTRFDHRPIVAAAEPWPHRQLALRDALALMRFLVIEDVTLARKVADRWPAARVTHLGGEAGGDIESAQTEDFERWLEERRYHYSAVLASDERFDEPVRRSQPQAARSLEDPLLPPPGEEPRG